MKILQLDIIQIVDKASHSLWSANGSEIQIIVQAEVEIYLKGLRFYQRVEIAKELKPQFLL